MGTWVLGSWLYYSGPLVASNRIQSWTGLIKNRTLLVQITNTSGVALVIGISRYRYSVSVFPWLSFAGFCFGFFRGQAVSEGGSKMADSSSRLPSCRFRKPWERQFPFPNDPSKRPRLQGMKLEVRMLYLSLNSVIEAWRRHMQCLGLWDGHLWNGIDSEWGRGGFQKEIQGLLFITQKRQWMPDRFSLSVWNYKEDVPKSRFWQNERQISVTFFLQIFLPFEEKGLWTISEVQPKVRSPVLCYMVLVNIDDFNMYVWCSGPHL